MDEVDDSRFRTATATPKRVEVPCDQYVDYTDVVVLRCACGDTVHLYGREECAPCDSCGRSYEVVRTCVVYQIVNE